MMPSAEGPATTSTPPDGRLGRWTPVAVLALLGGIVPILIAWRFGALGIPRNDDWSYVRAAFRFADGGGIDGNDWAVMNLVGQLVLALPVNWVFDNRIAPLQVGVAVLGVVGLLAVYDLASRSTTRRRALFIAALLAVGPMWADLAGSFMTDLPAFSLSMVCLAAGARAVDADDVDIGWFTAALGAGMLAFSIRQPALIAVAAVIAVALWTGRRLPRRRLVLLAALGATALGAMAVFQFWHSGLPGFGAPRLRPPTPSNIRRFVTMTLRSALLVGFLVTPAVLLAGPRRLVMSPLRSASRLTKAAGLAVGTMTAAGFAWLLVVRFRHTMGRALGPGNYVLPEGRLGTQPKGTAEPDLFPPLVIALCIALGAATVVVLAMSAALAAARFARRVGREGHASGRKPSSTLVTLALIGFILSCTVPVLFGNMIYDRYLLPVIALTAIAVLADTTTAPVPRPSPWNLWSTALAAVLVAAVGVTLSANSASFDGVRWRLATSALSEIGDPAKIDAGFEWVNYHAGGPVSVFRDPSTSPACVVVRFRSDDDAAWNGLSGAVWAPFGEQTWAVVELDRPC